jgi:hypothetical protein
LKKYPQGIKATKGIYLKNLPNPSFSKRGIGITANSLNSRE